MNYLRFGAKYLALVMFLVLSTRFVLATLLYARVPAVVSLLVAGVALPTFWRPAQSVRVIILLLPLVFGLGRAGLLAVGSPEVIILGSCGFALSAGSLIWVRPRGFLSDMGELTADNLIGWSLTVADGFAALTCISFLWWSSQIPGNPGLLGRIRSQPNFGYSDPLFPVTDTLVWLLGWFYFRVLIWQALRNEELQTSLVSGGGTLHRQSFYIQWAISWMFCALGFFCVQVLTKMPDGFAYDRTFSVPTSMFSDPHSMGSVCVSLGAGLIAWVNARRSTVRFGAIVLGISMAVLVGVCYSRSAWLSSILTLGIFGLVRRRKLTAICAAIVLILCSVVAWKSSAITAMNQKYLTRIVSLIRLDRLSENHEARLEVYRRAPSMIGSHPILGFGPGSSRYMSRDFVAPTDQWGPDFMHNVLLQLIVEQGIPAGILFMAAIALVTAKVTKLRRFVENDPATFGLFFALLAYLITQMTSNSLNVYPDQQLFFFGLAGFLLVQLDVLESTRSIDAT